MAASEERGNGCKWWDFTAQLVDGLETVQWQQQQEIHAILWEKCEHFKFQLERAPTTGSYHFQGRCCLITKARRSTVHNLFKAHWSETHEIGEYAYVIKDESRVLGPWAKGTPAEQKLADSEELSRYIEDVLKEGDGLKPFQQHIIDKIARKPERREIDVIIDPIGGSGKTFLMTVAYARGLAIPIPVANNAERISQFIHKFIKKAYIIDIPRSTEQHKMGELWAGIESCKNGFSSEWRFSPTIAIRPPPHVWVFSNTPPPLHMLSSDRWRLWTVVDGCLEPFNAGPLMNPSYRWEGAGAAPLGS